MITATTERTKCPRCLGEAEREFSRILGKYIIVCHACDERSARETTEAKVRDCRMTTSERIGPILRNSGVPAEYKIERKSAFVPGLDEAFLEGSYFVLGESGPVLTCWACRFLVEYLLCLPPHVMHEGNTVQRRTVAYVAAAALPGMNRSGVSELALKDVVVVDGLKARGREHDAQAYQLMSLLEQRRGRQIVITSELDYAEMKGIYGPALVSAILQHSGLTRRMI